MKHAIIFSISNSDLFRNFGSYKVASGLRDLGWDVEVIDYAGFWSYEQLEEVTKSRLTNDTVFVGFSDIWGSSGMDNSSHIKYDNLVTYIKSNYSHVKIIVGSQEIPASSIKKADYYIQGYAEHALQEVIKHILGTSTQKLKYKFYRNGKFIDGTNDYPAIFMPTFTMRYEKRDFINPKEQLGIELSRGCKFECDFCSLVPLGVKGDNFRTADDYINQLKYLNGEFGLTNFFLTDSNFNPSSEKLETYAEVSKYLDFQPWIAGFTRADVLTANPDTWDSMIAMGFVGHHYGVETFNQAAGKSVGKGMRPEKLKEGLINLNNYFSKHSTYRTIITMIAGLPYETLDEHINSLNWLYDNLPNTSVSTAPLFIPHPNNEEYARKTLFTSSYEKYGYVDEGDDTKSSYLKWYNTITKESFYNIAEYLKTYNIFRETYVFPWVVGITRIASDLSLQEALNVRVTYSSNFENIYPDKKLTENVDKYIQAYINDKLNWSPA
jgi:radical SAM superfamily enzyme YgiQ (UPF0313 family)